LRAIEPGLFIEDSGSYLSGRFDVISKWTFPVVAVLFALLAPHPSIAKDCPGLAEDPVLIGEYDTPASARWSAIWGTIAYVADDAHGNLQILDVSDPSNPTLLGTYDPPSGPVDVEVFGTRVYLALMEAEGVSQSREVVLLKWLGMNS
jgi:hypothetical protein